MTFEELYIKSVQGVQFIIDGDIHLPFVKPLATIDGFESWFNWVDLNSLSYGSQQYGKSEESAIDSALDYTDFELEEHLYEP